MTNFARKKSLAGGNTGLFQISAALDLNKMLFSPGLRLGRHGI